MCGEDKLRKRTRRVLALTQKAILHVKKQNDRGALPPWPGFESMPVTPIFARTAVRSGEEG